MIEIWKDVVGYENRYQVSNLGRVKSLARPISKRIGGGHHYFQRERILRQFPANRFGHLLVELSRGGRNTRKALLVHRLVLEAFVGPCLEGMESCHEDGNPGNNILSNLRWDTHANNEKDKERHGTGGERRRENGRKGAIIRWDGKSPGTKDMISQAKKKGLKVRVVSFGKGK